MYNDTYDRRYVSSFKFEDSKSYRDVDKCYKNRHHRLEHDFNFYKDMYENDTFNNLNNRASVNNITSIDNSYDVAVYYHNNNNTFINNEFVNDYSIAKGLFSDNKSNNYFYFSKNRKLTSNIDSRTLDGSYALTDDINTLIADIHEELITESNDQKKLHALIQKLVVKLRFDYHLSYIEIAKRLRISLHFIKNAMKNYKNGPLNNSYHDYRGSYKKGTCKRTLNIIEMV